MYVQKTPINNKEIREKVSIKKTLNKYEFLEKHRNLKKEW